MAFYFRRTVAIGNYYRTTVYLNHQAATKLKSSAEHLKPEYSQKAVFLKGVDHANALYLPSAESVTQSHVFASEPVNKEQTPVMSMPKREVKRPY